MTARQVSSLWVLFLDRSPKQAIYNLTKSCHETYPHLQKGGWPLEIHARIEAQKYYIAYNHEPLQVYFLSPPFFPFLPVIFKLRQQFSKERRLLIWSCMQKYRILNVRYFIFLELNVMIKSICFLSIRTSFFPFSSLWGLRC